jgi:hypothetical protein
MPALADSRPLTQFRALSSVGRVDAKAGILYGVSVITLGPALGHNVTVDEKGIKQCLKACEEFGDEGVKLVVNHDSGFQEIVGSVKNFRISGLQLLGDAHLLDTPQDRDHILELAQKLPRNIGLSVETYGNPETIEKKKYWRVDSIDAIALVPNPAANAKGLFSKKPDAVDTSQESTLENMEAKDLTPLIEAALKPLSDKLTALEAKVDDKSEQTKLSAKLDEHKTKLEALPTEAKLGEVVKAEVEKAVKEQAPQIAADAVTKFAASVGVKPGSVPDGQLPDGSGNDKGFEGRISTHLSAMPNKDRGLAIQRARKDDPEGFNKWSANGGK